MNQKLFETSLNSRNRKAWKDLADYEATREWARRDTRIESPKVVISPKPKFSWLKQLKELTP